ncbi:MAG: hypothetical protein ACLT4A_10515 [Anaerobutyricum soehngenii]
MYRKKIQHEKENLSNRLISEELIYACLMTCEKVISKNAYLEKKWGKWYEGLTGSADDSNYRAERLTWMEYRKKLQSLLLTKYSIKEIIQNTKSTKVYTDTAPKTLVKLVIELIDSKEYELVF